MKKIVYLSCMLLIGAYTSVKPQTQPDNCIKNVEARQNANDPKWKSYQAYTVDYFFNSAEGDGIEFSPYGGWKVWKKEATGYFRTELVNGRWWIIDPEGYPYIHRALVAFEPGTSDNQKAAFAQKFANEADWAQKECKMLSEYGFNGAGAWSSVDILRRMDEPVAYTVIVSPMASYKAEHIKKFGGKYEQAGWQGYRYDLIMVFDKEFDEYITYSAQKLAQYKDDKYMLGYFTDNELPWVSDALDRHLRFLDKEEAGYKAAKQWLDARKGFDASLDDITDQDRAAFSEFYADTYFKKVATAMKVADPNHLYLGCRFNEHHQELKNPNVFKAAGKYMDIVSINHYRKWQPEQESMKNWEEWSGKPFLITEWYAKGEDSGLPNETGAGWNVHTQKDRGYFYQNFAIELLKSKGCVGWHWFRYQDNDPLDLSTDPSNRDSNKGVIDSDYNLYHDLMEEAKILNKNTYKLLEYFQGTIDDFENTENSNSWINVETSCTVVDNPLKNDLNQSNKVIKIVKKAGAENWSGLLRKGLEMKIGSNAGEYKYLTFKVLKPVVSDVSVCLRTSNKIDENYYQIPNTIINNWEYFVIDLSNISKTPLAELYIRPDYIKRNENVVLYIDDIVLTNSPQGNLMSNIKNEDVAKSQYNTISNFKISTLNVSGIGNINIENIVGDVNLNLINMQGQIVEPIFSGNLLEPKNSFQVKGKYNGVYILNIIGDKYNYSRKIFLSQK